jgi:hypothetical protein
MQKIREMILKAAAAGLILLLPLSFAYADTNPANDLDSITISITPVIDMGVDIDTASARFNYADAPGDLSIPLSLGATAYLISPATVTILGNVQPQELDISATVSGGWTLDADEAVGLDQIQVYALFGANKTSAPSEAEFAGTKNLIVSSAKRAGASPGAQADGNFENDSMSGAADMDNILLLAPQRQLWLRVDAPAISTTDQEQVIAITINATRTGL